MLVSIIVPAFNAEAYIGATLDSCLAQTLNDIEIIVVDDGSTDRTAEIVSSYSDPRIRVVRQENMGVSAARNRALEGALGRYIQFLDADDILDPRKLEHQVAALQAANDCGLSTSKWGRFFVSTAEPWFVPADDWTDLDPATFLILAFGGGGTMPPNSWLVPRALIGETRFHTCVDAMEDRVFAAEMAERSKRIVFSGEAVSYYRSGILGSLSAQINRAKMVRSYVANCLVAEIMLRVENSERMRVAAANLWMMYSLEAYPYCRELAEIAARRAQALGPPSFKPEAAANKFGALARVVGWKSATMLRRWFHEARVIGLLQLRRPSSVGHRARPGVLCDACHASISSPNVALGVVIDVPQQYDREAESRTHVRPDVSLLVGGLGEHQ